MKLENYILIWKQGLIIAVKVCSIAVIIYIFHAITMIGVACFLGGVGHVQAKYILQTTSISIIIIFIPFLVGIAAEYLK